MNKLKTNYGELKGIVSFETYKNNALKSIIVGERNEIKTEFGTLVPQYNSGGYGERQKKYRSSLSFFSNGQMKSAALEEQTPIITSMGTYSCELVTFYEDGSLNRIFPLNGKIDGFWSEEEEGSKAEPYSFKFYFGEFTAKIIGLHFYPSGALKSMSLWPGEKVRIFFNNQWMNIRIGFSLYEDGTLKSVEPAGPTKIKTMIGDIMAFDNDALGIHGDQNSLNFGQNGRVLSMKSIHSGIKVIYDHGHIQRIEPLEVESMIDDNETTILPIQLFFEEDQLRILDEKEWLFEHGKQEFSVYKREISIITACNSCSSCSSCQG